MDDPADPHPDRPQDIRVTHTRSTIREACLELLEAHDARSITISQLCKQAGISRGTFYQHHCGLEDVYADIVRQELARTAKDLDEFEGTPGHDPLERLVTFVHARGTGPVVMISNQQLASRVRPIVEQWLTERISLASYGTALEDLDTERRARAYFVAGGLATVLGRQARAATATASTTAMTDLLRASMRTVLHPHMSTTTLRQYPPRV
ncbi:MAG: TetR/AcrR family transcriptional regulator [Kocuria sp.]|uniref:TetR/AcrR family transcriptional regulator n=1 Tax=Kocuria TaxID=57493 RepID=UPI0026DAD959|nr:TetR/AcrR family transcriptional regulator [Kocuria sp.]MDO4257110.1 TetR/AcrR family transcriptional regulator [Kocuria sp.]